MFRNVIPARGQLVLLVVLVACLMIVAACSGGTLPIPTGQPIVSGQPVSGEANAQPEGWQPPGADPGPPPGADPGPPPGANPGPPPGADPGTGGNNPPGRAGFGGGAEDFRLFRGSQISASYAYWVEVDGNDRLLISCCNRRYPISFSVYATGSGEANVHAGMTRSSPIVYHLENGIAYRGSSPSAPVSHSLCRGGQGICSGVAEANPAMYFVEGENVYAGDRVNTNNVFRADQNIEGNTIVKLLIPILDSEEWRQW